MEIQSMETDRLLIRRVLAEDWESIKEIWQKVGETEYAQYDIPHDTKNSVVQKRIERWASSCDSSEHMFFSVCLKDEIIGYIDMHRKDYGYEIGYCFHTDYYRKGYAKESISALLDCAEEQGVHYFKAGTAINNIPSVRLLNSLGFKLTGTEQVSFYKDSEGNNIYFEGGIFEREE